MNCVAGATCFVALLGTIAQGYGAVTASRAIRELQPRGADLEEWQQRYESHEGFAILCGLVVVAQVSILFCARKARKEMQVAEPGASPNGGPATSVGSSRVA
jgi:hypothetical protein